MDEFNRCLGFIESLEETSGNRIERFAFGRAFFNTELPVVWDVNFLRVEQPGASWKYLSAAAHELMSAAGLSHRKMILPDEAWADDLCAAARRSGWEVTSLIFMVKRDVGAKTSSVPAREVTYDEVRSLREELARRQPWATDEDDVRQVLEANRRWAARVQARFFVADVEGEPAAACDLYRGPGLAQIEDVETKAEYRNRGLATAVVLAAADAVRADPEDPIVFLIADENDWPKALYEKMGFETVGRRHQLLKTNL